jgi:hypothetical protein
VHNHGVRPQPFADFVVVFVAIVIFVLVAATTPDPSCLAETCGPEPVTSIAISLIFAVPVMSFLHRWAAVWTAVVCVVAWPAADRVEDVRMGWYAALPLILLAATVLVARLRFPVAVDSAPLRQPPAPRGLPLWSRSLVVGAVLLPAGVAGVVWTLSRQAAVTAQETSARVVAAMVRDHHESFIKVDLSDGDSYYLEVLEPADYPLGARVDVLVDDAGLRQLRSEPYDITILLVPAVTLAGAGVALLARALTRRRALRRFLAEPRPVRAVQALDGGDRMLVMIPGPARTARQFSLHVGAVAAPARAGNEPATLYGSPHTGEWCVVETGGRVRVPRRPIGAVSAVPYRISKVFRPDPGDIVEPPVDESELLDGDRDPLVVHDYRPGSPRAWTRAIAFGLGGGIAVVPIAAGSSSSGALTGVLAAAVVLLAFELGWRIHLRPAVRWTTGGVAALTAWGRARVVWDRESGVDADESGGVMLTEKHQVAAVIPVPDGETHTTWQLVAALRHARAMARAGTGRIDPPDFPPAGRPWPLVAAALVCAAAAAALTGAL